MFLESVVIAAMALYVAAGAGNVYCLILCRVLNIMWRPVHWRHGINRLDVGSSRSCFCRIWCCSYDS
jgi:hypothetical protein